MIIKYSTRVKGLALFSRNNYKPEDFVYKLQGITYDAPTKFTIETAVGVHILDPYGVYMNHSFDPTCCIKNGCIVAVKNISVGDELTFDYNQTESHCVAPFVDADTGQNVVGSAPKT